MIPAPRDAAGGFFEASLNPQLSQATTGPELSPVGGPDRHRRPSRLPSQERLPLYFETAGDTKNNKNYDLFQNLSAQCHHHAFPLISNRSGPPPLPPIIPYVPPRKVNPLTDLLCGHLPDPDQTE